VTDLDEVKLVSEKYADKYDNTPSDFYGRFANGSNKHRLYKIALTNLELFDEVNFVGGEVITIPLA
jgi:hypothetical protein